LPYIQKLVNNLSWKIIITSDYGEIIGEKVSHYLYPFKGYRHPHPYDLLIVKNLLKGLG